MCQEGGGGLTAGTSAGNIAVFGVRAAPEQVIVAGAGVLVRDVAGWVVADDGARAQIG